MARRGFMAELQHQARVAAREADKRQRAAVTAHNAAVRKSEQMRKADERARAAAARASEADLKRLEKEAAAAHVAAMQAEVEERTSELAGIYEEIDTLLEATLEVDDFVDLETLRQVAQHPPFDRADLEEPLPLPPPLPEPTPPPPPVVQAPKGLIGRKKKLEAAQSEAEAAFDAAVAAYRAEMAELPRRRQAVAEVHASHEDARKKELAKHKASYAKECEQREAAAAEANEQLDALIANLGYGTVEAVQEYVAIVLANSVYPEHFEVEHEATFDPATAELQLRALIPGPDQLPAVKAFKYVKASDEVTETALSQKACKDRYLGAVQAVTLRSLHEIFEADRRGLISTISLEVGTNTIDPATGRPTYVLFAAVGAERESFLEIDLSAVVPAATLDHLGAAVSKNPFGLVAVNPAGVRRS